MPLPDLLPASTSIPEPPEDLSDDARRLWSELWTGFSGVLSAELDRATVERLCDLADERAVLRRALEEHGPLLEEPIVTPKGDVVGTRLVANPAAKQLREVDKQLTALSDRLGLSPAARARLGLTIAHAQALAHTPEALMARMKR